MQTSEQIAGMFRGYGVSHFFFVPVILPAAVLLGGFMSTLYPVCIAHAHDRMPADRVVAVSGRLILVSGLGSVLGPLIGASLMARFEIDGVFYFMAAAVLLLAVVAGVGTLTTPPPRHRDMPFEILTPQAGPLAHDPLDSSGATLAAQGSTVVPLQEG